MEIYDLPESIAPLIGKLRFRTSYGQNIILHSKEVAYIARSIAQLIGANEELAYRGGLLHCIETKIVQIADAISAVRPGARRMNSDDYLKRVQEME